MEIIIVGNGKVGNTIANKLVDEGHNIVMIDDDARALETLDDTLDVMTVNGSGSDYYTLKKAGVETADLVIAVTSTDEINIICCILSKKLGARHTIARIRNPEYKVLEFMAEDIGVNMTINPEYAAAEEIARILRFPSAVKVEPFSRGKAELIEVIIPKGNSLCGKMLNTLNSLYASKALICAVVRGKEVYIPTGSFVLQADDRISIMAASSEINKFFKATGLYRGSVRSVMIAGGGRIAYYLADMLAKYNIDVKIIEIVKEKCDELCADLPKATIINADATSEYLLKEEGIDQTDAFVALTGIDEENIIISMYATSKGVGKVVTKINKLSFPHVIEKTGIDCVISPKKITSHEIVRYVRSMQNTEGNNVLTYKRIADDKAEVLEFAVKPDSRVIGKKLRDLSFKSNILIAAIVSGGNVMIPGGDDVIRENDNVIVISVGHKLSDVNDILS